MSTPSRVFRWALAAPIAALLAHVAYHGFVADDAFIVLRYATNALERHELVFNPGVRVEGFTSPLFLALVVLFAGIGVEPLTAARGIGLLAGIASLLAAARLVCNLEPDERARPFAVFAASLVAVNNSFAAWTAAGLETSLFALGILVTLAARLEDRFRLACAAAAAAALTRPEGVLLVVALGVETLLRRGDARHRLAPWALIGVGPVIALEMARVVYFGAWLPNTFYAKTGGGVAQCLRGLAYALDYAADHEGLVLIVAVLAAALALRSSAYRIVAGTALLFGAAAIGVGGDGLPLYRFVVPIVPLLAALEAALLFRVWRAASDAPAHVAVRLRAPAAAAIAASVVALLWVHVSPPTTGFRELIYQHHRDFEVPAWRRVGEWLAENARPTETVAAVPIGALSYYSGLVVYDMLGLTDAHIARREMPEMGSGEAGHEKHDGPYILSRRPTYLLLGNIDITDAPRDPTAQPFIPIETTLSYQNEADVYRADQLRSLYQPRSVELKPGRHLNFYELRPEYRGADAKASTDAPRVALDAR